MGACAANFLCGTDGCSSQLHTSRIDFVNASQTSRMCTPPDGHGGHVRLAEGHAHHCKRAQLGHGPPTGLLRTASLESGSRACLALVPASISRPGLILFCARACQYFELVEDPLMSLLLPVIIDIVVPIIMQPLLLVMRGCVVCLSPS